MKKALSVLVAIGLAFGLTACNPPMPPEVRAALEEQIIVCEAGSSQVLLPGAAVDQAALWNDSLASDCPEMLLADAADLSSANLVAGFGTNSKEIAGAYAQIPFAVDAAVFLVNSSEMGAVALSPQAISGILSGEITNWNDPVIAADNPNDIMPEQEITLVTSTTYEALNAMSSWISRLLGEELDTSRLQATENSLADEINNLPDGGIMLANYSANYEAAWLTANVLLEPGTEKLAEAAIGNFASAATQWEFKLDGQVATVQLNPELPALPPQGIDIAPEPYQAVFAVNLALVGEDELVHRANARYLLRAASQSTLAGFNFVELPDAIRMKVIDFISYGLTVPELDPELIEGL
jgi:phosphate transport system substrate-binding protein